MFFHNKGLECPRIDENLANVELLSNAFAQVESYNNGNASDHSQDPSISCSEGYNENGKIFIDSKGLDCAKIDENIANIELLSDTFTQAESDNDDNVSVHGKGMDCPGIDGNFSNLYLKRSTKMSSCAFTSKASMPHPLTTIPPMWSCSLMQK